jgi:hypothetical protein
MSVRTSLAAVAVVVVTLFVVGCAQSSSPTSPSSSASSVVSLASSVSGVTVGALGIGPPITPIWAQLNLVTNFLVSANQQLNIFLNQGPPIIPGNPVFPAAQNSLDFYLRANGVLDMVAIIGPPITPQTTDALHAILGEAHTTLDLLTPCGDGCAVGPPIFLDIATQANHTILVANGLLTF